MGIFIAMKMFSEDIYDYFKINSGTNINMEVPWRHKQKGKAKKTAQVFNILYFLSWWAKLGRYLFQMV